MLHTKMSKKILKLKNNTNLINKVNPKVTNNENVFNLSGETFTKEELKLLSKGLKTCVGLSRNIE